MFVKQIGMEKALELAAKGMEIKVLAPIGQEDGWENLAPDTLHQHRMSFLYQAVAQRKLLKALYGKFTRLNIVDNIRHTPVRIFVQKRVQHIVKGCLCAFNLRGQKRLFPHIHGNK